ncbi:MAG: flagellar hook capping FlgD N-terminal domain-containing protein [Bryobacteraceae bacterium]
MATSSIPPVAGNSSIAKSSDTSTDKLANTSLADKNTFLQLLVAQLKNQDPQNPADGTAFVTQLAQFSTLEQQLGMKSDLDQILAVLKDPPAPAKTTAT